VVIVVHDSESDTESAEQDDGTRIETFEEQPEQEWKQPNGFSAKNFSAKSVMAEFFSSLPSTPEGKPCISSELLPNKCPNWLHGRAAEIASVAVKGLDAKAVHTTVVVCIHCTGHFGQYSSNDFLYNCAQAINQVAPNLDQKGMSSALQAILDATKAIPTLGADQKLDLRNSIGCYYTGTGPK
jgi:hypothetical protein